MSGQSGSSVQALQAEIAGQREALADTVDELQHRLDVKAQTRERLGNAKARMTTDTGRPRPDLALAAGLATTALVSLVIWRRSHS